MRISDCLYFSKYEMSVCMHVHMPFTIFCMVFFQCNVFTLMEGQAFENPMESHFAVSVF